ncbi:MAG: DUF2922 domain-containing protein [Veillonellaceae bacterium]|nr:DUF2922 domain-containing protein [Veillonellaceae bacterium]
MSNKTVTSGVQLVFKGGEKTRKVALRCPKDGLTREECKNVGTELANAGIFVGANGALNEYVRAERVERTVEIL